MARSPSLSCAALIVDVVGSRTHRDRAGLHDRLVAAFEQTREEFPALRAPGVTAGDEFQATYARLGDAIGVAFAVRLALAPEVEVRAGLGYGEVTDLSGGGVRRAGLVGRPRRDRRRRGARRTRGHQARPVLLPHRRPDRSPARSGRPGPGLPRPAARPARRALVATAARTGRRRPPAAAGRRARHQHLRRVATGARPRPRGGRSGDPPAAHAAVTRVAIGGCPTSLLPWRHA